MKACITASESAAATSRSRSPTVGRMRRRLPATSAAWTPGWRAQEGQQLLGEGPGAPERDAVAAAGERFDAGEDLGFGLLAHAGQAAQLAGAGGGFQLGQVGDAQLLPEQGDLLGSQVGHLQQLHQGGGHFGFQLLEEVQPAGGEQLVDLLGDGLAHAGDLDQLALAASTR